MQLHTEQIILPQLFKNHKHSACMKIGDLDLPDTKNACLHRLYHWSWQYPTAYAQPLFMGSCTCVVALLQLWYTLFCPATIHSTLTTCSRTLFSNTDQSSQFSLIFLSFKQIGSICPKAYNQGRKVGRLSKELTNTNHFHCHVWHAPTARIAKHPCTFYKMFEVLID